MADETRKSLFEKIAVQKIAPPWWYRWENHLTTDLSVDAIITMKALDSDESSDGKPTSFFQVVEDLQVQEKISDGSMYL